MKHTEEEYKYSPELHEAWRTLFFEMGADEIAFVINSFFIKDMSGKKAILSVEYPQEAAKPRGKKK